MLKGGLTSKKINVTKKSMLQKNVPNYYPKLFQIKKRSSEELFGTFFGGLRLSKKILNTCYLIRLLKLNL